MRRAARRTSAPARLALLTMLAVTLGACGSGGEPDEVKSLEQIAADARSRGYDWQAELLEDGDITRAEYDEGHRRNLECIIGTGATYSEPVRQVLDGYSYDYLISWLGVMDDEEGSEVTSECQDRNVSYLEFAMSIWGDWTTEPAVLAEIQQCVNDAGFETDPAARNYVEVFRSASDQGLVRETFSTCIDSAMRRVHPEVEGYAFGGF